MEELLWTYLLGDRRCCKILDTSVGADIRFTLDLIFPSLWLLLHYTTVPLWRPAPL
jgi:hypothetical protein